ncbi:MAG: phosphoribosylformylglycinamidine synthase subunit PurQ [Thermoproteota archaeon]
MKFPGTNCEEETAYAVREVGGAEAHVVWHTELRWRGWDAIVIPGGFSYGDYGRAGLIASWSRALDEVREAADNGVPILGICNGFQILVEAGILPGSLLVNASGSFVARWLRVRVHNPRGPWLLLAEEGRWYSMPVAHGEGRYHADRIGEVLAQRPWLEYAENPNGSLNSVAGIGSRDGLVLGLMPHPERSSFPWQPPPGFEPGGRVLFESMAVALRRGW